MNRQRAIELLSRCKPEFPVRFGVQSYLKDLLGCLVDLVTEKALRPDLRPYIEQERVNV